MSDFNEIYTNITNVNIAANAGIVFSKLAALPSAQILVGSAGNVATAVSMSGDATISNTGVVTVSGGGIVPIGTILPFYDYNGTLTFDNTKYAYCDGSIVNFTGIGPQTTPDLSGRYLIGFGTIGGGNIDTDPWATAAVGNAANTINLQHSHTVNAHTHGMQDHTHTIAASGTHTHTDGTLYAKIAINPAAFDGLFSQEVDVAQWTSTDADNIGAGVGNQDIERGADVGGDTGAGGDHSHGGVTGVPSTNTTSTASATGTDNQLSAVQEIRPSSIRVRYIIRYT